ncbi:hypothetical protein SAMN04487787_101134 [Kosakonia sacchari]|nr:hypothetical protein SAMN04487787_101134 [Kosakonia sacchari]
MTHSILFCTLCSSDNLQHIQHLNHCKLKLAFKLLSQNLT